MPAPHDLNELKHRLKQRQQQVDQRLDHLLPAANFYPEVIHQAMRHSVFAGGKRVRPVLCLEAAAAIQPGGPEPLDVACALECIHTYSLIHDDLPALDNDDFRRGQPTCHKVYGEAMAILAGDALLTIAFRIIAGMEPVKNPVKSWLVHEVASAAGTVDGMIGGQVVDVIAEGKAATPDLLEYIHRSKTGALLKASVRTGAIFAGAGEEDLARMTRYGASIGLLFQIVDDILDVEGSTEELGKTAGKDAAQAKATFPAVHGLERSRQLAQQTMEAAIAAAEPFGANGRWLRDLAVYVGTRKN